MKKIIINEDKFKKIIESKEEITYFSFFTHVKNFIKKLLQDPVNAKASDELREYFGCDDKHIIEKLVDNDIIRRSNNLKETPKEITPDGKSKVRFSIQYSVPKKNFKEKIHSLFTKETLQENAKNEYLDRFWGKPLHNYFNMSDEDEARNYLYANDNYTRFGKFIDDQHYGELSDEELDYIEDMEAREDDDLVEDIVTGKYSQYCKEFLAYLDFHQNCEIQPATRTMDYKSDVYNEWLVHFSDNADEIFRQGFRYATDDQDRLNYTDCGNIHGKSNEGYCFAYEVKDLPNGYRSYGTEAVLFQASGVKCYHYGDMEDQVMFWNKDAKNIVYIHWSSEHSHWWVGWFEEKPLYSSEDICDVVYWVIDNFAQYRKELLNPKESLNRRKMNAIGAYAEDMKWKIADNNKNK